MGLGRGRVVVAVRRRLERFEWVCCLVSRSYKIWWIERLVYRYLAEFVNMSLYSDRMACYVKLSNLHKVQCLKTEITVV